MCLTEAERPKQLRIDELSAQEKESKSTVNQLMVEIQELQDKVNSLSDAGELYDPETARSSGLSHIPNHDVIFQRPRGLPSRDSCLQFDTRNLFGASGTVFEDPLAPSEPTASCSSNLYESSLAATHCELVSLNTGRSVAKGDELPRNTHNFAIFTPRFARMFSPWNPTSCRRSLSTSCMVEQPRKQVSEMHFDQFPKLSTWNTFRCFHLAVAVCLGKKWAAALRTAFHPIMPEQFSRQL